MVVEPVVSSKVLVYAPSEPSRLFRLFDVKARPTDWHSEAQ